MLTMAVTQSMLGTCGSLSPKTPLPACLLRSIPLWSPLCSSLLLNQGSHFWDSVTPFWSTECGWSDAPWFLRLHRKKPCSFYLDLFGILALGEASPQVRSSNTSRVPCFEKTWGCHVKKSHKRGRERKPRQPLAVPAISYEESDMWDKKPSWISSPVKLSDDSSLYPHLATTSRETSSNNSIAHTHIHTPWEVIINWLVL